MATPLSVPLVVEPEHSTGSWQLLHRFAVSLLVALVVLMALLVRAHYSELAGEPGLPIVLDGPEAISGIGSEVGQTGPIVYVIR